MANLDIYIDPATKDYVVSGGNAINRNAILNQIYLRLTTPRRSFKWDVNFGSWYIHKLANIRQNINDILLINDVYNTLQDMVNNSIIANIDVKIVKDNKNYFSGIDIYVLDVINNTTESLKIRS